MHKCSFTKNALVAIVISIFVNTSPIQGLIPEEKIEEINSTLYSADTENLPNVDTVKASLIELLGIEANLNVLNKISLLNNTLVLEGESRLIKQLEIINVFRTSYGLQIRSEFLKDCFLNYLVRKENLLLEVATLKEICDVKKYIFGNDSQYDIHSEETRMVLHVLGNTCESEAIIISETERVLVTDQLDESLSCSVEANLAVLSELVESNYFHQVRTKNELLSQELRYLLGEYENHLRNRTVSKESSQQEMKKLYSVELEKISKWQGEGHWAFEAEFSDFKMAFRNISLMNSTSFNLSQRIASDIYDKYLKIRKNETDLGEIGRLIQSFNRLVEMIVDINGKLPKSWNRREGQVLFTGKSITFHKQCENSPVHLIGTCTPENNEICGRNPQTDEFPQDLNIGDSVEVSGLLFPKYCICGFRADCKPLLNDYYIVTEYSTCLLVPNEHGQCRGGVGYPCKSQPLQENKFHESCFSGTCNQAGDECIATGDSFSNLIHKFGY